MDHLLELVNYLILALELVMQLSDFLLDVVHELLLLVLVISLLSLVILALLWDEDVIIIDLVDLFLKHIICFLVDFHLILYQVLL
jgi:hypothetical protein